MRTLPDLASNLPEIAAGRRLLTRVLRRRDLPEPVAAWRTAPAAALRALSNDEKRAYLEALLPLIRAGRTIERWRLRRLYQLFAFMEMPDAGRLELVEALHVRLRLRPERLPWFASVEVRRSLIAEAIAMAGKSPSAEIKEYLTRLREHLQVKADEANRWTQLFEKLTDVENRVAVALGKKGHIVRLEERKLEIFKKAVASVGVPVAVLFPLGTVGLSVEGITTGLVALGGGFLLPTGIAMITGLGVAVALGVSSKKILDMVMPTDDADRASIDLEKLSADAAAIRRALDDATAGAPDRDRIEAARSKISEIVAKLVPLNEAQRAKLQAAVAQAQALGERYLDYLARDRAALETRNQIGADDLAGLLELDRPAIAASPDPS